MTDQNQLLRDSLQDIANWPDGGNRYGQEKIKAFASQVLATTTPASQNREPDAYLHDDGFWTAAKTYAGRQLNDRLLFAGSPKIGVYTTPPASLEQAQQPSTQAWANETGLRQIECPSCGDLAVAYDPQQPSGEVVAWRTFDGEGGYEYRDFEGNENYADEWAKRNPQYKEWVEPLTLATPKPEPIVDEALWEMWVDSPSDVLAFARRIEAHHGITAQGAQEGV